MKYAYAVQWVSGYLGFGVNSYEREYFDSKDAAEARAAELKAAHYYGVEVVRVGW